MKIFAVLINLVILSANADVTTNLGAVDLSSSIGKVQPLYKSLRPEDLTATKNAKDYVEWLRPKFPTGFAYLPPLEPYEKASLEPIPIEKGIVSGYIVLRNLRIDGAQKFALDTAELLTSIDTVNFAISLPELLGNVDFKAEIVIGIVPITITGHLKVTMTSVKVVGVLSSTETRIDGSEVFQVTADNMKLTADNLKLVLSQISIHTNRNVIKKWWSILKDYIANVVNKVVIQQINDVLRNYTTQEVRNFLLTP